MAKFQKGNTIGLATRFKKGETPFSGFIPWNKGKTGLFVHTEEAKEKIKIAMIGRKPWNLGLSIPINNGYNHYANDRKYCTVCEVYYNKEQYNTFKNPFHCEDCGRRLRSVPRGRTDRVYI
jgi:hypothetical protein